jgi:catechol 2,3-dioxygenase-like lactoylglutathione lyase family enzyme
MSSRFITNVARIQITSSIRRPAIARSRRATSTSRFNVNIITHKIRNQTPSMALSTSTPTEVPSSPPICTLASLDHLVLTVKSIPDSINFYTQILGMAHQSFTSPSDPTRTPRHALLFGSQKINLHQAGKEFEPKAATALPGTADLCFLAEEGVETVLERLKEKGIEVLEGGKVVKRTGARSALRSVYVRDPDGNLIE